MSATTGWVVGSWSWRSAEAVKERVKVVQASGQRGASAWQRVAA
jgi:hypothetical protein